MRSIKFSRSWFPFGVDSLSAAQNAALGYLISRGGSAPWDEVTGYGSTYAPNIRVTRPTIAALIERGLLAQGARRHVQLTGKAVGLICDHATNPHPAPHMAAAVWDEAHSHAAYRRDKGLDTVHHRIAVNRDECEALIRAQFTQVALHMGVQKPSRATTDRIAAAVRRIADAWAADVANPHHKEQS